MITEVGRCGPCSATMPSSSTVLRQTAHLSRALPCDWLGPLGGVAVFDGTLPSASRPWQNVFPMTLLGIFLVNMVVDRSSVVNSA